MSAKPPVLPLPGKGEGRTRVIEYLVSYGKNGAFGRFAATKDLVLRRGEAAVVHSPRGLELGAILCPATANHARLLASAAAGRILRRATAEDRAAADRGTALALRVFEDSRRLAGELHLPLEILDVEVLLDDKKAVLQYVSAETVDLAPLADRLAQDHDLFLLLENLALPGKDAEEETHGGCGKPDCGRAKGGGCSDCGSGGCSSCGSGKVDMRIYFAHLRTQMEQRRVPLL